MPNDLNLVLLHKLYDPIEKKWNYLKYPEVSQAQRKNLIIEDALNIIKLNPEICLPYFELSGKNNEYKAIVDKPIYEHINAPSANNPINIIENLNKYLFGEDGSCSLGYITPIATQLISQGFD